uniref:Type 1 phosphatases regulator n=1 Tax=Alexandrium andersonii TaxID=327968 RepID=A0A7S2AZD2_9DINO
MASSSIGTATETQAPASSSANPTLHLVLQPRPQNHVQWTDDTIDNEHLNKRKSKKCCIYNKPRAFGESDSESDGSDDDGAAKPVNRRKPKFCPYGGNGDGPSGSGSSGSGPPAAPASSSSG